MPPIVVSLIFRSSRSRRVRYRDLLQGIASDTCLWRVKLLLLVVKSAARLGRGLVVRLSLFQGLLVRGRSDLNLLGIVTSVDGHPYILLALYKAKDSFPPSALRTDIQTELMTKNIQSLTTGKSEMRAAPSPYVSFCSNDSKNNRKRRDRRQKPSFACISFCSTEVVLTCYGEKPGHLSKVHY